MVTFTVNEAVIDLSEFPVADGMLGSFLHFLDTFPVFYSVPFVAFHDIDHARVGFTVFVSSHS